MDNELEDEKELLAKEYEDKNDMKEDNSLEVESKLLNNELEDKRKIRKIEYQEEIEERNLIKKVDLILSIGKRWKRKELI